MKKTKIIITAFILAIMLAMPTIISANTQSAGAAGSMEDPLVTASYVAKYVNEILSTQNGGLNEDTQRAINDAVTRAVQNISSGNHSNIGSAASSSYETIKLLKNQKIRPKSGTLEIIVRPGAEAKIISEHISLGVADITTGRELLHNDRAPINHSLIIPRSDTRGIHVVSDEAYILVRGDYLIYD